MRADKNPGKPSTQRKRMLIRTTFFELIGALIDVTKNDAEILPSLKRIFDRSDVRTVRSLAPVRLAATKSRVRIQRKGKAVKAGPAWA
ncbi:MAG: hypothetical protein ACREQ2_10570 [Candidatus Binatia bacterium]